MNRRASKAFQAIHSGVCDHKWTVLVFLLVLFRPQLSAGLRNAVHGIKGPARCERHTVPFRFSSSGPLQTFRMAGLSRRSDDEDGCSGDGACASEEDWDAYEGDTDDGGGCGDGEQGCGAEDNGSSSTAEDDGCNDDGSCEASEETNGEEAYYADDGCSCGGETVVGTGAQSAFHNTTLVIVFTLQRSAVIHLAVETSDFHPIAVLVQQDSLARGAHRYPWSGVCGNGQVIQPGSYAVVLELSEAGRSRRSVRSFTYSAVNGFQVDGTLEYTVDFDR